MPAGKRREPKAAAGVAHLTRERETTATEAIST